MHASSSYTHSSTSATSSHHRSRSHQPVEGSFCQYSHRICMQNKLDGYDYCIKHILEDSTAPYRQCNYISNKTGKRCVNATARSERKDGYCLEHTRRTILLRQKASRKRKPPETPESLLDELDLIHHRANPPEVRRARSLESLASRILGSHHEYASSSDSDMETTAVEHAWRGDYDSDAESVDSEQEDPLKHAGIYTAEEVALLTRDKLIRLQSLYIDQFKRLQHLLKEKRRNYLHTVRMDREQYGSISSAKDDPEQRDGYDKLQALKRYHKRFGKEALLHRQSQERRKEVSEGLGYHPPSYPKCTHQKVDGSKCLERTVPLSKFCFQHILEDQFQILFRPCNYGDGSCQEPTATFNDTESRCLFHTQLQSHEHRLPKRQSSEESNQSSRDGDAPVDIISAEGTPLVVGGGRTGNQAPDSSRQLPANEIHQSSENGRAAGTIQRGTPVNAPRRYSQQSPDSTATPLSSHSQRRPSGQAVQDGTNIGDMQPRRLSQQSVEGISNPIEALQVRRSQDGSTPITSNQQRRLSQQSIDGGARRLSDQSQAITGDNQTTRRLSSQSDTSSPISATRRSSLSLQQDGGSNVSSGVNPQRRFSQQSVTKEGQNTSGVNPQRRFSQQSVTQEGQNSGNGANSQQRTSLQSQGVIGGSQVRRASQQSSQDGDNVTKAAGRVLTPEDMDTS